MKHIIITGASRGIGKAIAENCKNENAILHLIARSDLSELKNKIQKNVKDIYTYNFDLSKSNKISELMTDIFKTIEEPTLIGLINNAATIKPVGPIGKIENEKIQNQISVNLTAPILLSNSFIKLSKNYNIKKRIINISSGAAKEPYYGWGGYCASKSGIDMVTKIISLEQNEQYGSEGVDIASLAPGIVDTEMQKKIRKQPKENFIYVGKFIEYYKSDILRDPNKVAQKIIELIFLDFFPDGEVLDITEL